MNEIERAFENRMPELNQIRKILGREEILAQLGEEGSELGEEGSELAKAALKERRVLNGKNYTPVTEQEAEENLQEEFADTLVCMVALGVDEEAVARAIGYKIPRWLSRLEQEEN